MNILIFNWRDPKHPNAGGAEIVTREHAKFWIKAGHHVTWFSSYFDGAKEKETLDGFQIIRKGNQVLGVQLQAFFWYLFGKHKKFDLVIDQFHGIPFFTPLYIRAKKLAFIHEVTKEVWRLNPLPKPFNLIPYVFGSLGEQWIFKLFYREIPFWTVSESTRNDLMAWGIPRKKITIIHNGVAIPRSSSFAEKEKRKTIIFLGALSMDKGVEDALQSFSFLKKNDPQWQFWLVGNGDDHYIVKLQKLSEKLNIKDNIKFWGYVSETIKFKLLAKAHLLINPSVREGWGLVIIEAASQKTPAVVYNVPGLRDSVKDKITGIVVKKRNPKLMADAIITFLNKRGVYKTSQKNAVDWAKSLTWKNATKKSLDLLLLVASK